MKKHLLLFLLFFLSVLSVLAGLNEDIISKVQQWNELHNTRETGQLKNLYADKVLFYGRNNSREECYRRKIGFLKSASSQEIVSPIQLTYYASGIIKATFTKKVMYEQTVKEHYCYLLFEKEEGDFRISGESDLQMDERQGILLNLGKEITAEAFEGTTNYILFIAIGIAVLLVIAFLLYQTRKRKKKAFSETVPMPSADISDTILTAEPEPETIAQPEELIAPQPEAPVLPPPQAIPPPPQVSDPVEEQKKGHAFECYVVERFNKDYFTLLEWRSDKFHEGRYAESNKLPDLEYRFTTSNHNFPIAIECKWRADFFKGRIEWAKSYQLKNYRQYELDKGIPVYVLIGIGGEPTEPDDVYIIPLQHIKSNVLWEKELRGYLRQGTGNFFLDGDTMLLS